LTSPFGLVDGIMKDPSTTTLMGDSLDLTFSFKTIPGSCQTGDAVSQNATDTEGCQKHDDENSEANSWTSSVEKEPSSSWIDDFVPLSLCDYLNTRNTVHHNHHLPGDLSFTAVWPSSKSLLEYLLQQEHLEGTNVLELGSGTGWLGITLARNLEHNRIHQLVLTDCRPTWTQANVDAAKQRGILPPVVSNCVSVAPMDWKNDAQVQHVAGMADDSYGWNLILGSDLVYSEDGAHDLANAMAIVLAHNPSTANNRHKPRLVYAHTLGRMPDVDDLWLQELVANGLQWKMLATLPVLLNGTPWEGRSTLLMEIYIPQADTHKREL